MNMKHKRRGGKGKLGYCGVRQRGNVFEARIVWDGKQTSLGYFKTAEEAARVYDRRSEDLRGFKVNFP